MRIILGITGASGVVMGKYLLAALNSIPNCETHLIVTEGAKMTWKLETAMPLEELTSKAAYYHHDNNLAASISSGSFVTDGMIVAPCSMKSLAGIVSGYAEKLLVRAADVCLKEGRKVVLVPRETPLGRIHLRNLLTAAELGCVIVPPMLTLYNNPQNLSDQIHHIIGKILMQFGIEYDKFVPWEGAVP